MVRARRSRWGMLLLGIVFITGSSSTIWAWQRLKVILVDSGALSQVCDTHGLTIVEVDGIESFGSGVGSEGENVLCAGQDMLLTFAWKMGCLVPMIAAFPFGIIFDRVGPRWTGVFGQLQFMIGFILFGVGGPVFVYYIAFCLIGLAQIPIYQSLISVCNLFPSHPNLVIALMSSAGDCSYNVPWVLIGLQQLLLRISSSLTIKDASRIVFIVYGCVFSGSQIIAALLFFPDEPFIEADAHSTASTDNVNSIHTNRKRALMVVDLDTSNHRSGVDGVVRDSSKTKGVYEPPGELAIVPPLGEGALSQSTAVHDQMRSKLYCAEVVYFFVSFLQFLYYNGAVDKIIGDHTSSKEQQMLFLWAFGVVQGLSFLLSLTFGYTADRFNLPVALVIHNTFACISLLGDSVIPTAWMQPVCFVSFQIFASFIFTQAYAWMRIAFGFDNVNTLMGLNCAIVGTVSLATQGIAGLMRDRDLPYITNDRSAGGWILIIVRPLLFLVPAYLWRRTRNPRPVYLGGHGSSSKQASNRHGYSVAAASEPMAELGRMHTINPAFRYGEESLKIATWSRRKASYEHQPLEIYSDSSEDGQYEDDDGYVPPQTRGYDYELTGQL